MSTFHISLVWAEITAEFDSQNRFDALSEAYIIVTLVLNRRLDNWSLVMRTLGYLKVLPLLIDPPLVDQSGVDQSSVDQ
jgi:hypothetical protein